MMLERKGDVLCGCVFAQRTDIQQRIVGKFWELGVKPSRRERKFESRSPRLFFWLGFANRKWSPIARRNIRLEMTEQLVPIPDIEKVFFSKGSLSRS